MTDLLRVMVVDEDLDSRVASRKTLQRAEFTIAAEAGFGTEAVSSALETLPDLVLVAVEEPISRPLETAEALANALGDTPIIVYSSDGSADSVRRSMVFGARDYLVKPLQAGQLRDAVTRALGREELRQMRRAGQLAGVGDRGTVIAVTGAKGGVGKTVTAVNLAVGLREHTDKSVVIVDADTDFGDVATMLDLTASVTAADLLAALPGVDRESVRSFLTAHESGVEALLAPPGGEWQQAEPAQVRTIVDLLARVFDFVIVDTSGAFDPFVRACVEASTLTLVITSGDVSSVRNTALAVGRLDDWGIARDRVRYILNSGTRARGIGPEELAHAIGRDVMWEIPHDDEVPTSVQVGQPLVARRRRSRAAREFIELAQRIAGTGPTSNGVRDSVPLWRRAVPLVGR